MEVMVKRVPRELIAQEVYDSETEGWQVTKWKNEEVIMQRELKVGKPVLFGFFTYVTQELHIRAYVSPEELKPLDQTLPVDLVAWKQEVAELIQKVREKR